MDLNRIYTAIKLYEQQPVKDIEKGTISTYEEKKPKKLDKLEYSRKLSRYTYKLLANKIDIADVENFLQIDDVPMKQAKQMLDDLEKELVKAARELQHETLTKIETILALPSKWHIINSNMVEVYPKPVLKDNAVIGTIYETDKAFLMPEELLAVYFSYSYQVIKFIRGDQDHDLTNTEQSNVLLAKEFKELGNKGLSHKEIAAVYGTKTSRVTTAMQYLSSKTERQETERAEQATRAMLVDKAKADKAAAKKQTK